MKLNKPDLNEYVIIEITNDFHDCWYKRGDRLCVAPYRYNKKDFWELDGWDGIVPYTHGQENSNLGWNFFIAKRDAVVIRKAFTIEKLPNEIFEL